jgi:hypothetical protein
MSEKKFLRVAQYLVAKDGKTKYLKFEASPNADAQTKKLVGDIIKALGGNVLYINIFDEAFKSKHNIKSFVKGSASAPPIGGKPTESKASVSNEDDEVAF